MERARGALVDKCHRCGTWLRRASAEQHEALHMALLDIALQLPWPTPAVLRRFPSSGPPRLRGSTWWWQMMVQAFDRAKDAEDFEMAPAVDGLGFDGRGMDFVRGARKRRKVNSVEISEMIEYVNAFAAEHNVPRRKKERKAA